MTLASITLVKMNVLWNGAGIDLFFPKKGLRQGDLISPCLFVLCIDKLAHIIDEAVDKRKWESMGVGRREPNFSHLMFVDDLLLFGKSTRKQMVYVFDVLNKFYTTSG